MIFIDLYSVDGMCRVKIEKNTNDILYYTQYI